MMQNPFLSPIMSLTEVARTATDDGVLFEFSAISPAVGVIRLWRGDGARTQRLPAEWSADERGYVARRDHVTEALQALA